MTRTFFHVAFPSMHPIDVVGVIIPEYDELDSYHEVDMSMLMLFATFEDAQGVIDSKLSYYKRRLSIPDLSNELRELCGKELDNLENAKIVEVTFSLTIKE